MYASLLKELSPAYQPLIMLYGDDGIIIWLSSSHHLDVMRELMRTPVGQPLASKRKLRIIYNEVRAGRALQLLGEAGSFRKRKGTPKSNLERRQWQTTIAITSPWHLTVKNLGWRILQWKKTHRNLQQKRALILSKKWLELKSRRKERSGIILILLFKLIEY